MVYKATKTPVIHAKIKAVANVSLPFDKNLKL